MNCPSHAREIYARVKLRPVGGKARKGFFDSLKQLTDFSVSCPFQICVSLRQASPISCRVLQGTMVQMEFMA